MGDYGHGSVKGGIYHYNLKTGVRKRLPIKSGRELRISGDRIVYETFRIDDSHDYNWHIYLYDISKGVERRITPDGASAGVPDIDGTKIVWQDFRNQNDFDVYLYDLVTRTETRITTDPKSQAFPRISGDRIVWEDDRNGILDDDVYLYDIPTGVERRITTDPSRQFRPSISGPKIVWQDERNVDTEIYLYDVAAGVEQRVTNNPDYQGYVSIAGTRIVYEAANEDIYLTELDTPLLSASAPATIPHDGVAAVIGRLRSSLGVVLPGRTLSLEVSTDKSTWTTTATTTTDADGAYTLYSAPFTTKRYLRARFAGDAEYPGALSSALLARVRISFSSAPRSTTYAQNLGSAYKVWGYIEPKHGSGSRQIKIKAYRRQRKSDGTLGYVYNRTFTTTTSNPSGSTDTKYSGWVRLPRTGRWRLRAYHAADSRNDATYSEYRYVTVQ